MPAATVDALEAATRLAAGGRYQDARGILQELLRRAPGDIGACLLLMQVALALGDHDTALRVAQCTAGLRPELALLQYWRGRAYKAGGDCATAVACYRQAARAEPGSADILVSLGIALRALGQVEEAVAVYRQALAIAPGHALAHNNLANALVSLGDPASARECRAAGRAGLIRQVNALYEQARQLRDQGRLADAMGVLDEALHTAPKDPVLLTTAAELLGQLGRAEASLDCYERLIDLEPDNYSAVDSARRAALAAGLVERGAAYSARAMRLAPSDEVRIAMRLSLPAIQDSRAQIEATRRAYAQALDELLPLELQIVDPYGAIGVQSFYLAYHGLCDRELLVKTAALYARALPSLCHVAPHCERAGRRPGKIRVGFLSRFLFAHSIGKTTRGLVEKLDRDRFEVHLIRVVPSPDDATTALMRASADHTIEVSGMEPLAAARQRIADLQLDILFYQDIGMEPMSYFLSFARLAPVQCVSYGHPNTTGVPTIDYFVSNDLYEPENAQAHYSERLFLLRDLPTLAYYYRPETPRHPPSRASLGLPEEATLYVCPQTLFKFHPDIDGLLKGIMERDPGGRLVLIRGAFQEWMDTLVNRFHRTMPAVAERIHFLPHLPPAQFMQLLAVSDVMLDTPHFNGQNSSLEALALGLPVVTLPTGLQRGRHTRAMYLKMNIDDCIAQSPEDYIRIAVRLGTDAAHRQELRNRILARNAVLFENEAVVREFERFFATVAGRPGPDTP